MKRVIIGTSAFALAICGFVATKANKKFTGVTQGNFKSGLTTIGSITGLSSSNFTTSSTSTNLVRMVQTAGSSAYTVIATLFTNTGAGTAKVYHH